MDNSCKKMICVHPNYELYGSDRSFANTIKAIMKTFPHQQLEVIIPKPGPILTISPFNEIPVKIKKIWILRRRNILAQFTKGLPGNFLKILRAITDIRKADVVYINTIVVFDYIFGARFTKKPVIIHVREIPTGKEMTLFRALLIWSRAILVFNSEATRAAFSMPTLTQTHVVYNGYADPGECEPRPNRTEKPFQILLIGRLNHWKGQEIAIAAISQLPDTVRNNIRCRIVGSVFEQQNDFQDALIRQIQSLGLESVVELSPFENDPAKSFMDADVVLVPSRLPEPFGRVAIEAMAYGKPVIASCHGGLVEIVEDKKTGFLIPPSDVDSLTFALRQYIEAPELAREHGNAGRKRFIAKFTEEATSAALMSIVEISRQTLDLRA